MLIYESSHQAFERISEVDNELMAVAESFSDNK
jgi:hypothetical protein